MDFFLEVTQRIFVYGTLFVLLGMRSAIPNPLYHSLLKGGWLDRFLNRIRVAIPWSMFTGMGPRYHDIAIEVGLDNGEAKRWSLLSDELIGGIPFKSPLTRLTLVFYFRQYPQFWESLREMISRHYREMGVEVIRFDLYFELFNTLAVDEASSLVKTEHFYHWPGPQAK